MSIFSLGDLVVLVGVAITLLVYRAADKQNRALNRVQRFIEQSKEDLAIYVRAQEEAFEEINQKFQEQELAVKNLQDAIEQTLQDVDSSANRVQTLKDSIKRYDNLIIDLATATKQMDSTIVRVEKMRKDFEEDSEKTLSALKERLGEVEGKVSFQDREKTLTAEVRKLEEETKSLKKELKTTEQKRVSERKQIEEDLIKRIVESSEEDEQDEGTQTRSDASGATESRPATLEDALRSSRKAKAPRRERKPSVVEDPAVQSRIIDLRRAGNTCQEIADMVGATPVEVEKLLSAFEEEEEHFESWESIKQNNFA